MKHFLTLIFAIIVGVLIINPSGVKAMYAASPVCNLTGTIDKIEFIKTHYKKGDGSSTNHGGVIPDQYLLYLNIENASAYSPDEKMDDNMSSCEDMYQKDSVTVLTLVDPTGVKPGLEQGDRITGKVEFRVEGASNGKYLDGYEVLGKAEPKNTDKEPTPPIAKNKNLFDQVLDFIKSFFS